MRELAPPARGLARVHLRAYSHAMPVVLVRCVRAAALAMAAFACLAHATLPPSNEPLSVSTEDDDETGALIGELVFHADLLSELDRLCARAPTTDWHGPLAQLLDQAFTPELRELSRRLGADAGAQLVQQRGGCRTSGFEAAYKESKDDYRSLLQRWRSLGE